MFKRLCQAAGLTGDPVCPLTLPDVGRDDGITRRALWAVALLPTGKETAPLTVEARHGKERRLGPLGFGLAALLLFDKLIFANYEEMLKEYPPYK